MFYSFAAVVGSFDLQQRACFQEPCPDWVCSLLFFFFSFFFSYACTQPTLYTRPLNMRMPNNNIDNACLDRRIVEVGRKKILPRFMCGSVAVVVGGGGGA